MLIERPVLLGLAVLVVVAGASPASPQTSPLAQVGTIDLGDVTGRIDHLTVDVEDHLLFVAELGNNSVSVIDLDSSSVRSRLSDLPRAQGLAYVAGTHTLYVATGIDGMLRSYSVPDMSLLATVPIGVDADNVHADPSGRFIAVGFSNGLALLDTTTGDVNRVALSGHVEGFQFEPSGARVVANIPDTQEIVAIDVTAATLADVWSTGQAGANFPMAIDGDVLLAGFRAPGSLGIYALQDGHNLATLPLCGDSDDIVVDPARQQVHVICGSGEVITFVRSNGVNVYELVGQTPTAPNIRTGLFVPELGQLFVAARAQDGARASIWIYAPNE